MSEIEEKRKKRLQFFHKVYEKTGGSEYKTCNMWTIGEELGFSRDETHDIQRYLTQETLIEPSGMGGSVKMSHYGIVEMEESLTKPKEATEHFPPSINIINIGTMKNSLIQQNTSNSTQVIIINENQIKEIKPILTAIEASLDKLDLSQDLRSDLDAELKTIQNQLKSSKPKRNIMSTCFQSIKDILIKAGAGVLANELASRIDSLSFLFD